MEYVIYAYIVKNAHDDDEQMVFASDVKRLEHFKKSPNAWEITPLYKKVE